MVSFVIAGSSASVASRSLIVIFCSDAPDSSSRLTVRMPNFSVAFTCRAHRDKWICLMHPSLLHAAREMLRVLDEMVVEEELIRFADADGLGGGGRENDEENEKRAHAPQTSVGGQILLPEALRLYHMLTGTHNQLHDANGITRRWGWLGRRSAARPSHDLQLKWRLPFCLVLSPAFRCCMPGVDELWTWDASRKILVIWTTGSESSKSPIHQSATAEL